MPISLGNTSISNVYLGSTGSSNIYLGSNLVWSSITPIGPDTIYLRGMGSQITRTQLTNKLSGETITYFVSQSGDVYASSSTDFGIANRGFVNTTSLTAYEDGGRGSYITESGFQGCSNLVSVTMPSASGMGTYAFYNCTNLVTASLPRITEIPDYAFRQTTALKILNINSGSVTRIGTQAFAYSGLPTADFPNVTTLGPGAFDVCAPLTYANFPNLTAIPTSAFKTTGIRTINAPNATSIGPYAFYYSGLYTASFAKVATIAEYAFIACPLQLVELPALSGSNAIGGSPANNFVFQDVTYTGSITVPSEYLTNNNNGPDGDLVYLRTAPWNWTVNYIPSNKIFIGGLAPTLDQSQLQLRLTGETITSYNEVGVDIYVSSSTNYTINADAFRESSGITSYVDGGKCTGIGDTAFYLDTNLRTASFSSATSVGDYGFYGCTNLTTLNLPKVTTVGYQALANIRALTTLDLPELLTAGELAFSSNTATTINAPKLTSIPNSAFNSCSSLTTVKLGAATSVGTGAFQNCVNLTDLSTDGPLANVTTVGAGAFSGCTNLTYIDLSGLSGPNALGGSPTNNNVFSGVGVGGSLLVPIEYQTNNAGEVDGDIAYLVNVQGWGVQWIGPPPPPTVVIGTQIWTLDNLDVTTYRNGDTIPEVTNPTAWANLTTGAWCWYNNDSANGPAYGKLYNWHAIADPRGLTPTGFHIPTNAEFQTLITYLGGSAVAGGALKEAGIDHWSSPNTGATNSSGFTARGGGRRQADGSFDTLKQLGFYHKNDSVGPNFTTPGYVYMYSFATSISSQNTPTRTNGYSIRCIKD